MKTTATAANTSKTTTDKGLTAAQKTKLLNECEATIKKGQAAFFETAKAVLTIRQKQLYKPEYKTLSSYFSEKWDFTPADITRFTNAAEVLEALELHGFTKLPENEGQTRALYEVKGLERRLAVWDAVIKGDQKITANLIREKASPKTDATPVEGDKKEDVTANPTLESVAQKTTEPKEKCSAKLHVEVDSSVLKDALEYKGVECNEVLPGVWEFAVEADSKADLFRELASWSAVYAVKKVTIVFA